MFSTPDHFIPPFYLAGLAAAGETTPDVLVRGYSMGSIKSASMELHKDATCAARLPEGVPPDQTNM